MSADSENGTEWRERLSRLRYGQHVRRLDVSGVSLVSLALPRSVWFDRCRFVGADLRHATLDGSHFKLCDFTGADLRGASPRGASFAGCDLTGVDLRGADLFDARFGAVGVGAGAHPTRLRTSGATQGRSPSHMSKLARTPAPLRLFDARGEVLK
ncbi:pentapeptide repeat-containing protein [Actinotalea solisilvae]|uniref:pentapeptide repeat-containing protein n=1 Tax=Actinotalea solisilvae TaxID=2072922 RepID=UPI0027DC937A|nr:pentapeptide repeat-containing protein [Actinotalea solisilvae]